MSKRKATLVSNEDAVRDILNFVERDDGNIENILSHILDDNVKCERDKYEQLSDKENDGPVTQRVESC